jgi:hypothetical protein
MRFAVNVPLASMSLACAVLAAAGLALTDGDARGNDPLTVSSWPSPERADPETDEDDAAPPADPGTGPAGAADEAAEQEPRPSAAEPSLTWTAPATWPTKPNASAMRIATLAVPHARGDAVDAELSIARAGGGVEANIERWIGQFADAGKERRRQKTVRGLRVTIVELDGAYGGMSTNQERHTSWALLGAIVETPGQPYFFKLVGPAATVRAARAPFEALVDSVKP